MYLTSIHGLHTVWNLFQWTVQEEKHCHMVESVSVHVDHEYGSCLPKGGRSYY